MGITDKLKENVKKAASDVRDRTEGHQQGAGETTPAEGQDHTGSDEATRNPAQAELDQAQAESREQSAEREAEASRGSS